MDWSLDGKEYRYTDEAPIGCDDCNNCSSCCHMMGDTIIQDPYDLWLFSSNMRLAGGIPVTFDILISEDGPWELSVQEGLILPNLKMVEEGRCAFLNEAGRCSIHKIRSGFCRLFPLGRGFREDGQIIYYVLNKELGCEKLKGPGDMVSIHKWLGYSDIDKYESFCSKWHDIKKNMKESVEKLSLEEAQKLQAKFLDHFYVKSYKAGNEREFWDAFNRRCEQWSNENL